VHKPFEAKQSNGLEIFNELCIYALAINFYLFTDWNDVTDTRWGGGYSADVIIVANFVLNLLFVFYVQLKMVIQRLCRKKLARKAPYLMKKDDNLVEVNLDQTMDNGIVPVDVDLWNKKPRRKNKKKFKDLNSTVSSMSIISDKPVKKTKMNNSLSSFFNAKKKPAKTRKSMLSDKIFEIEEVDERDTFEKPYDEKDMDKQYGRFILQKTVYCYDF
jgi:hypothetical protein